MLNQSVKYPKSAYFVYFLFIHPTGRKYFVPMLDLFADFSQIRIYSKKFISASAIKDPAIIIPPAPIVFPLTIESDIRLKKEYWDEPVMEYTRVDRINNFLKPIQNHHFYKLLVIPTVAGKKTRQQTAYCFNITAKEPEINLFLATTFLSMDIRAKNAAIYTFGNPVRYEYEEERKVKIRV